MSRAGYMRDFRSTREGSPFTPHGTRNGYGNYKCRCEECRDADRAYKLKLTYEDVRAARVLHAGGCGVCGDEMDVEYLDHDHETGRVRGWLCRKCNIGIGHFRDDPSILRAAADYLDRSLET